MIQEQTIRKLTDYLLLNTCTINSSGLYDGKAGLSLSLFEAARYLQDENVENRAFELLQEALVGKSKDCHFENGLSGIGYVLLYLIENKFIDADFDDIFKEQYEKIINNFSSIEKEPGKLLNSMKVVYFLSISNNTKKNLQTNLIIEKIFDGVELYLSIQFYDFKNIRYVKDKSIVLKNFEIYLKLIYFSGYKNFSKSLLNDYFKLYNTGRIISSVIVGYYLEKIAIKENFSSHCDNIIESNKINGIKNICTVSLTLNDRIEFTKLINAINKKSSYDLLPNIGMSNERVEKSILKMIHPNSFQLGYQSGLARYLIFCLNEKTDLL